MKLTKWLFLNFWVTRTTNPAPPALILSPAGPIRLAAPDPGPVPPEHAAAHRVRKCTQIKTLKSML